MAELKMAIATPNVFRINEVPAAVVPAVSTVMGTLHTQGAKRLFVQLNVAVAALTAFEIDARPTPGASYVPLYSISSDFLTPRGLLVGASGDLTTQGVGSGWFIMDVAGLESIQIKATSGGTATLALNMGAM